MICFRLSQITTILDDIAEARHNTESAVAAAGGPDAAAEMSESLSTAANGVRALLRHADAADAALARRRALQEEILRRLPPRPNPSGYPFVPFAVPAPVDPVAPAPAAVEPPAPYTDMVRRVGEALFPSPPQAAANGGPDSEVLNGHPEQLDANGGKGQTVAKNPVPAAAGPAADVLFEQEPRSADTPKKPVAAATDSTSKAGGRLGEGWGGLAEGWGGLPVADPAQVFASFFVMQPTAARTANSGTGGSKGTA